MHTYHNYMGKKWNKLIAKTIQVGGIPEIKAIVKTNHNYTIYFVQTFFSVQLSLGLFLRLDGGVGEVAHLHVGELGVQQPVRFLHGGKHAQRVLVARSVQSQPPALIKIKWRTVGWAQSLLVFVCLTCAFTNFKRPVFSYV